MTAENRSKPKVDTSRYLAIALIPSLVQIAGVTVAYFFAPGIVGSNWTLVSIGVFINLWVAIALYNHFTLSIHNRIDHIAENQRRLVKGEPLREPLMGNDEIAIADKSIHDAWAALKKADQNRQDFVSMVSHDLRSPITSLGALFEVLDSGVLGEIPEAAKKRIQSAQANVQRLMQLTEELLDIRKLEEGKMDVSIRVCDLRNVIERAVQSVEDLADKKSLKIERPDTNVKVLADENRIVQVLVNLLSNAIKFSYKNGVVKIAIEETEDEIEVQVIDFGRGMSLKNRSAVFDRFRQTESGRSAGGSGLGLNIAKAIIQEHDGAIGFDSTEGVGSKFWFRIARVPGEQTENK